MPEISLPSAVDVLTQLVTGPSLREVATTTLRQALKTLYPNLEIDPQRAMVATPTWVITDEHATPGADQFESLTDALVRLGLSGATVTYLDDEHFLTLQPTVSPAIQLPVKISAIARLINELAPLLFVAYKEQHIDYWSETTAANHPRWYQLSDGLRRLWNVDASLGWDADEQAMARAVFNNPDKRERTNDKYKTRACLIDLDHGEGAARKHATLLNTAVLIGTLGQRTLVLTHSVVQGFRRFASVDEIGNALPHRFREGASAKGLSWRLVEPEGDFFNHQACTVIALEADALGQINFFEGPILKRLYPHAGTAANHHQPIPRLKPHIERLKPMLPEWLDAASPADQTLYARYLLDLTVVQHANQGKSFQNEVNDLHTFTREALTAQILKDHPTATDIKLDDIEMTIVSLVIWGTFIVPGEFQTKTLTLLDLALQNLAGLPLGNKRVAYKDGSALPQWMTVTYVEELVKTVDIGSTYPAYLKKKLLDDATQASALQDLYSQQLPLELPLLALQHKIRGEAGITELGYRYVVAALSSVAADRQVDGQEIVIRPLAFVTHRSTSRADTVDNMFVIGPRDPDKGPCLLYRPLFEKALIQYPGPTNLLYAIKHSQDLRESVLAWLPDSARFNFSQYVFAARVPSVWVIPEIVVHPLTLIDMSRPVTLGSDVVESDVLATLHKTNVQAVITQADRQSVSNAEARWATLKRGGWALFNAALPFLGRGVAIAAWIWQIMDDLQEVSDAANQQSGKVAWSALADILLALGMVLAHRAAVGHKPAHKAISAIDEWASLTPHAVPELINSVHAPDIAGSELVANHGTSINTIAALEQSNHSLAALLDRLNVSKPEALGAAASEGPYQHLYQHDGKWYAPVDKRWFQVQINEDEHVQIIDSSRQPPGTGPFLVRSAAGQWVVDLRLRLSGGSLSSRRKQVQRQNKQRISQHRSAISAFDLTMASKLTELTQTRTAMDAALPETAKTARKHYLDLLDSQLKEYGDNIKQIRELNSLQEVPNFRAVMIERLEMQLFLGQEWLIENSTDFQANIRATTMAIEDHRQSSSQRFIQTCEEMSDQTQGIMEKIDASHARFAELERLGEGAVELLIKYRKTLPDYDLNDFKLLQISLGQEICVKPGTTAVRAQVQSAMEQLIESAALNVQSSLNLSTDESLHNLGERIDTLNHLTRQFAAVDQGFGDIAAEFADQLNLSRLARVRERVKEFSDITVTQLAGLLRDRRLVEPQAGPSRPAGTNTRKIIKTRSKGTLVGVPKAATEGGPSDLVELRSNMAGVIATFQEESPGVWVEHITATPTTQRPKPPSRLNLNKSIRAGQALLDGLAEFHRVTDARIKRGPRLPVEVEEEYHRHAALLRKANADIDEALTARNATADLDSPTQELGHALEKAAKTLDEKGTSTRARMIKQQMPTGAGVEWLNNHGEVTIAKILTRRELKSRPNDFLDEYEVRDIKTNKVVCYAHFHYSSVSAPLTPFLAGHLKTNAQRHLGGTYELRGLNNQQIIDIHRSEISTQLAETLFFTPAKPAATGPTQP